MLVLVLAASPPPLPFDRPALPAPPKKTHPAPTRDGLCLPRLPTPLKTPGPSRVTPDKFAPFFSPGGHEALQGIAYAHKMSVVFVDDLANKILQGQRPRTFIVPCICYLCVCA